MSAPQRRDATGVIDQLLCEPQQFDFFQAVRLLDRWMASSSPDGQGLARLNFRNSLALSFPPSAIESLKVHKRVEEHVEGAHAAVGAESRSSLDATLSAPEREPTPRHAHEVDRIDMTPA